MFVLNILKWFKGKNLNFIRNGKLSGIYFFIFYYNIGSGIVIIIFVL